VIRAINAELNRAGAPGMVRRAAFEAGIVESGLRNLNYGDRDSLGVFQQRPSQGWGSPAQVTDPRYAARQVVTRAIREHATGRYRTAGQLAQAVQRSAFPGRYQEHIGEAKRLARASRGRVPRQGGAQVAPQPSGMAPSRPGVVDAGQGGDFASLLGALLDRPEPEQSFTPVAPPSFAAGPALPEGFHAPTPDAQPAPGQEGRVSQALGLLDALRGTGPSVGPDQAPGASEGARVSQPIAERVRHERQNPGRIASGTAKFDGKIVAAWIKPALKYARQHGWNGTVNSGFRSYADQKRIWDSGVRPAARPGHSNHEGSEFPRGAVDVSDAEQLARILERSPWRNRLVWAGAKDPVHFSFPHNGSY
jgi:hypothetical protein